jgi:hypothetical protein
LVHIYSVQVGANRHDKLNQLQSEHFFRGALSTTIRCPGGSAAKSRVRLVMNAPRGPRGLDSASAENRIYRLWFLLARARSTERFIPHIKE